MKPQIIFLLLLLMGLTHCKEIEDIDVSKEIHFNGGEDNSDVIVSYDDIIGYDEDKYVFRVKESAWNRLQSKITPMYPDPHFGFSVMHDNQIIYMTHFVPGYYSASRDDIITFWLHDPDLVFITLGYPPSEDLFTGEDLRNDARIIKQLKADNKLMEIKN